MHLHIPLKNVAFVFPFLSLISHTNYFLFSTAAIRARHQEVPELRLNQPIIPTTMITWHPERTSYVQPVGDYTILPMDVTSDEKTQTANSGWLNVPHRTICCPCGATRCWQAAFISLAVFNRLRARFNLQCCGATESWLRIKWQSLRHRRLLVWLSCVGGWWWTRASPGLVLWWHECVYFCS